MPTTASLSSAPFTPARPAPVAVIDVGSTSVRMEIAEIGPDGPPRPLEQLVHPVALGLDTFRLGSVTPANMRAICQVLANFARVMKQYRVQTYRAVATSAIRDASNKDILLDRIWHESGLRVEVLDAVGEMSLTYQILEPFLKRQLAGSDAYTLVLDLGGGSTEILVLHGASLVLVNTRRLGTVRLFQSMAGGDCENTEALLEALVNSVVESTRELYRSYSISECVVINAHLAQALAGEAEAQRAEEGLAVPSAAVRKLAREAARVPPERVRERFHLTALNPELLYPAALVVSRFLEKTKAKQVWLLHVDLLHGLLHGLQRRLAQVDEWEAEREQIVNSTLSVGEKYRFDEGHARLVARLAARLFDGLAGLLGLERRDKLLLEVAALLHDIGTFVGPRAHHKHSAYLIRNSEIVGLSEQDLEVVAQVARYHRKRHPAPHHIEYVSQPVEVRMRIAKLAAVLRLADALDRGHTQAVREVQASQEDGELLVLAAGEGDLTVETAAMREKGRLFEEITGLNVRLRRAPA